MAYWYTYLEIMVDVTLFNSFLICLSKITSIDLDYGYRIHCTVNIELHHLLGTIASKKRSYECFF